VDHETRGGRLCMFHDVETVQDAGGVLNIGGKKNGGVGGRRYIYT
jgi:hypothetical protein